MSAAFLSAPTSAAAEPRARFRDLLAAEWIKLRSLRSTYWVLALSALVAVAINVNGVHSDFAYIDQPHPREPGAPPFKYDPLYRGLSNVAAYLMAIAAGSVGAITVFGEFTTGLARTTFIAVPDRRAVIAAKVALIGSITLAVGVAVSVASFFVTNAMLASRHVGLGIRDPGCLRAVTAYAVVVPVCALIGMALGAALRHATATTVSMTVLFFLAPMLFGGDRYRVLSQIGHCLPLPAMDRLIVNPDSYTDLGKYPATVAGSWVVLGAWAVLSVVVAFETVRRRDV